MQVSPEQIALQMQSDRTEFSGLDNGVKIALRLQVDFIRRPHTSFTRSQDKPAQADAA